MRYTTGSGTVKTWAPYTDGALAREHFDLLRDREWSQRGWLESSEDDGQTWEEEARFLQTA